jgi:hypothetical protein
MITIVLTEDEREELLGWLEDAKCCVPHPPSGSRPGIDYDADWPGWYREELGRIEAFIEKVEGAKEVTQ